MNENFLHTPISFLPGIGAEKTKLLQQELGINTYFDLLHHYPFRYVDKSKFYPIKEVRNLSNTEVQVVGKIISIQEVKSTKGKRLVAKLVDSSGEVDLVWFKYGKWLLDSIYQMMRKDLVVYGKINQFNHNINIVHPELQLQSSKKIDFKPFEPVYPSTEKLQKKAVNNRFFQKIMHCLLQEIKQLPETIPADVMQNYHLLGRLEAYQQIHFPTKVTLLQKAQFRLKFDEFFFQQILFLKQKINHNIKFKSYSFKTIGKYFNQFYDNHLDFELTNAQKRVIKEIRSDLYQDTQMNRLLQGDVGSGKTIVALLCMLIAIDNGFQATIVAPTETLAQQHFNSISKQVERLGLTIALLTGSTTTKEREVLHQQLLDGQLHILVGTHAVLEPKVVFRNLGLCVVDEQHKFGVAQRAKLYKKNKLAPHMLVMTATPIPRTLAMTLYGDLSISIINELPKGRKPIKTYHKTETRRLEVFRLMKNEIAKGRQVYVVYPLIEESKVLDYNDLMDGYEGICREFPLPQYAVSVVHGRMKSADKDFEMQRFAKGETQIMVSTTVIEVGVNVPNASVMLIESAEKFGLSQLHQLRGRVGRGTEDSYCILMTKNELSQKAQTRIKTMCQTNDGFKLAEVDLELRGPGDLMGTQQSGILQYKIADLVKDKPILEIARTAAKSILEQDPNLDKPTHLNTKNHLLQHKKNKLAWSRIG